jgi:serine/threonine protein kinase
MVYVAEGTYGCVYRPPIKCKNGKKYTRGKISKLMTHRAANKEVKEYEFIKKVDKDKKYYPGPPIQCDVDPVDAIRVISPDECQLYGENPNINDYELLIYNDGGYDLKQFTTKHLDKYLASNIQEQTDKFFFNALRLFEGIDFFLKKDLLHHDLKPHNIVFDPTTYRFNFIDFGLVEKKSKLINDILKEKDHENFHWSYPLEFGFLNYSKPYYIKYLDINSLSRIEADFKSILTSKNKNSTNLYNIKPDSFKNTFRYMENREFPQSNTNRVEQMMYGLLRYIPYTEEKYEMLVEKLLENVDIYALGFTMNHMINCFYDKGALTKNEYNRYSRLFQQMFNSNLEIRTSFTATEYKNWYEQILNDLGVFTRLGITGKKKDEMKKTDEMKTFLQQCPEGKEYNIDTKRCIKSCLPGQYRDVITRRCKKIKVVEEARQEARPVNQQVKLCVSGKEMNPQTRRCRNICKAGTVRNNKGRCVKE